MDMKTSMLLWLVLAVSGIILAYMYQDKRYAKRLGIGVAALGIVRSLVTLGVQPTLFLLGLIQVSSKYIVQRNTFNVHPEVWTSH